MSNDIKIEKISGHLDLVYHEQIIQKWENRSNH